MAGWRRKTLAYRQWADLWQLARRVLPIAFALVRRLAADAFAPGQPALTPGLARFVACWRRLAARLRILAA
ncbi:hypothetical protein BXU06_05175 [Aquaspirillum sp. LM1]|nr:hypothetical protein BXU06_05175 [Aquaspirillum sp. LM1]